MQKQPTKKQLAMRKKVGCLLEGCGQHFTFTANKEVLAKANERQKVYTGTCHKCHKVVKLSRNGALIFQNVYGNTSFNITTSTFDSLFTVEKD